MWTEPSQNNAIPSINDAPHPAVVEIVEKDSIGEDLGFEPGDKLISINGIRPRDLIDYRYLISEEDLQIEVIDQEEKLHKIHIEKDQDDGLGLVFTEALFDGLKQCNNHCPFCFIDQQPHGRRKTLYLKDDDYRMSFLYGSYLTLTNLTKTDWQRIENQRLSPLFVSVHSTNGDLRAQLLKNKKASLIINQIKWFSERKLQLHAQVVVCPGLNDDENLENTLNDLFAFSQGEFPTILSTAVVPVGLTRFRPDNDGLKPVDQNCAMKVIALVEKLQATYQSVIGTRFAWLSDEWYLIADIPLPNRVAYEDLPQEENGVGSIRYFLENMDKATKKLPKKISVQRNCSWVVGKLVGKALEPISKRMNAIDGLTLNMFSLTSPYWGKEEVVTGLLTGQDVITGLQNKNLGDVLLLPSVMLKHGEATFLDDISIKEVEENLKIPIKIVFGPEDFVKRVIEG
ncbi:MULTISPECIES: TIGR03279 family radical SAM protein [unclassified Prochlorococcus]|uniref:TIGR03279 family radical SAM protein n=1 Tax=unclassified Prochlorococcus TaxID=2627481 RepID=UPI00053396E1|nr:MULTISPECIES: TIGR03279 family radical SAM protein [unclassified Prochlorococcus]KGG16840.1 putative Fe-S oxidoreductase [Prochlorococcus sp. MIT 0602]KGG18186.1 putative Fe-S oxidoreductase [Prochlorococcus sp. MIT 0603]